jgi:hypothetical protein
MTRETVLGETPARAATSLMVMIVIGSEAMPTVQLALPPARMPRWSGSKERAGRAQLRGRPCPRARRSAPAPPRRRPPPCTGPSRHRARGPVGRDRKREERGVHDRVAQADRDQRRRRRRRCACIAIDDQHRGGQRYGAEQARGGPARQRPGARRNGRSSRRPNTGSRAAPRSPDRALRIVGRAR